MLRTERDLLAQDQLKVLLNAANRCVANDRRELRVAKARLKRSDHQMP